MLISEIVYIGPKAFKDVSGRGKGRYLQGVPQAVPGETPIHADQAARSILRLWPGEFAAVLPCNHADALADLADLRAKVKRLEAAGQPAKPKREHKVKPSAED